MTDTALPRTHRRLKPYSTYKDSGVGWLGKIPAHWEVKRLKRVFRVMNGSTPASSESGYWNGRIPWVTPEDLGDLSSTVIRETRRSITESGYRSCGTTLVPSGSLVLSTRAPIGHLAVAGVELCTNQGCRSLVFRDEASRQFFFYQVLAARPELESLGQGSTFMELAKGRLEYVVLAEPATLEQCAIATFLDRETARIDALVAKKERVIELLKEKRTALITRAVTKGLEPNLPMKESGVEWLGKIPAHWEVKALGRTLLRITYGFTNPMPVADVGPYMLTALDIGDGEILFGSARRTTEEAFERLLTDKSRPRAGDLLITKDGTLGRVAVADGERICINQSVALLRLDSTVDVGFMQHTLRAVPYQERMAFEAGGTAIKHIYVSRLARMLVAIPATQEQRAIATFLDGETARIDAMVAKVRDAIDRLKELRTALISAAVTGKMDVREEAT